MIIELPRRPVRELAPEIARKIAAGEVIDRPAAIVRELLDNAVDAGAKNISVEITGGGIEKIRVVDDGCGMTKDDLEHCARPHATSKIADEIDLLNISTLGFRGEALASIAAVSRLAITSARDGEAWTLRAGITGKHLEPANLHKGTVITSESLFEDVPARRHFLKRPASEAAQCRQLFVEKAIPRPDVAFRYTQDGALKIDLAEGQTLQERFAAALQTDIDPRLLFELHVEDFAEKKWRFTLVIGDPSVARADRKYIFIYANGRKINEYALMQAIEYGAEGFFPNGTHPAAALFLEIDPALVDFNIHPAKKEARFKDISPIHRAVSGTARQFFHHGEVSKISPKTARAFDFIDASGFSRGGQTHSSAAHGTTAQNYGERRISHNTFVRDSFTATRDGVWGVPASEASLLQTQDGAWGEAPGEGGVPATKCGAGGRLPPSILNPQSSILNYLGTAFGVFLVAEKDDALYFIDQHAAHEKILYEQFIAARGQRQPLLIPYVIETENAGEDDYLESIRDALGEAGFDAQNCGGGRWEFSSAPILWQGTEEDLRCDILEKHLAPDEVLSRFAATCACRKAVKEGDALGDDSALFIAEEALAMDNPRCPHGRPLWFAVSRDALYQAVQRT